MIYYRKVNGEILLTEDGHNVLSFFGLSLEDLQVMSKEQLIAHTKKFSDILNNGKITKGTGGTSVKTFGYRNYCQDKGYDHITEKAANPERTIFRSNDEGSYSRYFSLDAWADKTFPFIITPKASRSERNKGCEGLPLVSTGHIASDTGGGGGWKADSHKNPNLPRQNHHPTVKPLKLMSYLITMGSREGDLVLDPFCGSGTVCIAADQLHRKWIGIEKNEEYAAIIKKRLMVPLSQLKLSVWSGKKKDDSDGFQRIC